MTLGIVVFGAAFLVGLGLGTYTRRPFSTAFLVLGSFCALLVLSATGEALGAAAVLVIVLLVGLVADPGQAEEMGRRARERVLDEHTYTHRARRLLELVGLPAGVPA